MLRSRGVLRREEGREKVEERLRDYRESESVRVSSEERDKGRTTSLVVTREKLDTLEQALHLQKTTVHLRKEHVSITTVKRT